MTPLFTIVGPTATGKSDLAVELALRYNGEVVSADSRQVYRGLDIGTGKITTEEMRGVPHWCLDIWSPHKRMTVADYKSEAQGGITDIYQRGALPMLTGGTGFYVQAVVDDITPPTVPPDPHLRDELEKKDTESLRAMLRQHDRRRYDEIHPNDRTRLIRALEIVTHLGKVPKATKSASPYDLCMIGLDMPDAELRDRINRRLKARLEDGMIDEIRKLHKGTESERLSWKHMEELGLEYRYGSRYARGHISYDEMFETLNAKIWQFAKRQRMWFRRDDRITWFQPNEKERVYQHVTSWLSSQ